MTRASRVKTQADWFRFWECLPTNSGVIPLAPSL